MRHRSTLQLAVLVGLALPGPARAAKEPIIIDHRTTDLNKIPQAAIEQANIAAGFDPHQLADTVPTQTTTIRSLFASMRRSPPS